MARSHVTLPVVGRCPITEVMCIVCLYHVVEVLQLRFLEIRQTYVTTKDLQSFVCDERCVLVGELDQWKPWVVTWTRTSQVIGYSPGCHVSSISFLAVLYEAKKKKSLAWRPRLSLT